MFIFEKLRECREEKGLSQEQMVIEISKLGLRLSRQTLANWETGVTAPDADSLSIMIIFFGKPVKHFFDKQTAIKEI